VKRLIAVIALGVLSGCGGGDSCPPGPKGCGDIGGFDFPSNLTSAPGEAALVGYLRADHQATLNATDTSGNRYSLEVTAVPNSGTTTFNGSAPAYSTVVTVTLTKNGALAASSAATAYYFLNPYVPLGTVYGAGTPFAVTTSSTPFPATLTVGNSGPMDNFTYFHDSTMAGVDADGTATYSVKADNPLTLLLCLNSVISGVTASGTADGLAAGQETDCYSVDASANAALRSVTLTVNGAMLSFT
jgi:hypothetical protein